MSDDIETIRKIIADLTGFQAQRGHALAALQRLEHSYRALQAISVGVSSLVPIAESLEATATVGSLIDWVKAQIADRDRLQGRVATLQKALDDRFAADQRAAKAIFAETGRTSGFPSVKEAVAYYVAEVERLEKESNERLSTWAECRDLLSVERAKADRAREALAAAIDEYEDNSHYKSEFLQEKHGDVAEIARLRAIYAELSADAPAQRTYDPRFDGDPSTWPLYNPARQQPITPPTREWCERMAKREGDQEIGAGKSLEQEKTDPRDPDPTRKGIFRDHNCWKCNSGANPCIVGNPSQCKYPHARND